MLEILKKDEYYGSGYIDTTGCHWDSKSDFLMIDELDFCGCGNPEEIMDYVKAMLMVFDNKKYQDYADLPYMFFAYWATHKGYLEHGSTIRCSWLTDKGKQLLLDIIECQDELDNVEEKEN